MPTRTLAQIRTHAQRFLARHAPAAEAESASTSSSSSASSSSSSSASSSAAGAVAHVAGLEVRAGVRLRHVFIEPVQPGDALGIELRAEGGALVVSGFQLLASLTGSATLSAAEESDLVHVGERLVGVSGVALGGLSAQQAYRAVAAARAVSLQGAFVLHLADGRADAAVAAAPEEVAVQLAGAAMQMLGSKQAVETIQAGVAAAIADPSMVLVGGS